MVWMDNEPTNYYLNCSTTAMTTAWCWVDKWTVYVSGSTSVEAGSSIDITLNYVKNPAAGVLTQKFFMAIKDANNLYTYADSDFETGAATIAAVPAGVITLARVMTSNHNLFGDNATYDFDFYLAGNLGATEQIKFKFPMSYDLYLNDGDSEYTCSTSSVESDGTSNDWCTNCGTSCTAMGNYVALSAKAYTITSAERFNFEVQGVGNPESAFSRTSTSLWDFDDSDADLNMEYDSYTEKFTVFTWDSSAKNIVSRSYGNLDSAYVGFDY